MAEGDPTAALESLPPLDGFQRCVSLARRALEHLWSTFGAAGSHAGSPAPGQHVSEEMAKLGAAEEAAMAAEEAAAITAEEAAAEEAARLEAEEAARLEAEEAARVQAE